MPNYAHKGKDISGFVNIQNVKKYLDSFKELIDFKIQTHNKLNNK